MGSSIKLSVVSSGSALFSQVFYLFIYLFICGPTGDQEIEGSIPARVILCLTLIQEGQLSSSGDKMCAILVNRLEDLVCPVNVWLGKLTALDMTPMGWPCCKTSTQIIFIYLLIRRGGKRKSLPVQYIKWKNVTLSYIDQTIHLLTVLFQLQKSTITWLDMEIMYFFAFI